MTNRSDHSPEPGSTDLLAVLTAIRPSTDINEVWDPRDQAAVRDRITAGNEPTAAAIDELAGRRARKRRPLAVLAVSGLVLAGGVGAAAAGGLMPQAFIDRFSASWQTDPMEGAPAVDPSTAERVATAPGPDGEVFTVMSAAAADNPNFTCTVAVFETPESAALPGPAAFVDVSSNWCQDGPETLPFGSGANVDVFQGYYIWNAPASDAVRGELRTPSGETYPVVSSEGRLWGWFPARVEGEPLVQAELIGYAADGTEIGRQPV